MDKIEVLIKSILQAPTDADIDKLKTQLESKLKNVNINTNGKGIKLLNSTEIDLYQKKMQNAIDRLKIGKDAIFSKSAISGELSQLTSDINKFGTQGGKSTKELALQFDTLKTHVAQISNEFKNVNKDGYSFTEMVNLATKKILIWGVSTQLVYGSLRRISEGLQTLKELDSLMVDIAKVTDLSAEAMDNLKKSSFETASAFGRTAQDYLKATAEFARAGYEDQSQELSKISLLAQNVGELTSEQANQFLLATDAAYKYAGSQYELGRVLDGVNEIDNKFATSIQKVSEGMTVAGSIASNAGVGVNELAAATGTMTAVTQRTGNEAGRAFRSILMNIRQIKGETEDGEIIDDETLSKSAKALDLFNTKVHETRNGVEQLRNPMEVLKELSEKWGTDTMKQAQVIEALGGKHRGNFLVALIENWKMYEEQLNAYANASGSAMAENEKRMTSWETKANQLSNAIGEFWNRTVDTNLVKGFIDSLTYAIKTFGNLGTIATYVGVILAAWKGKAIVVFLAEMALALKTNITVLPAYIMGLGTAQAATMGLEVTTSRAKIAMLGLGQVLKTNWFGLLLTGITLAITAFDIFNSKQEKVKQVSEQLQQKLQDELSTLRDLSTQYDNAIKNSNNLESAKTSLKSIQDQLIKTFGTEASGIDLVNGKYDEQKLKIIDLQRTKLNSQIGELQIETDAYRQDKYKNPSLVKGYTKNYKIQQSTSLFDSTMDVEAYYKQLNGIKAKLLKHDTSVWGEYTGDIAKDAKGWVSALNSVNAEIDKIQPKMDKINQLGTSKTQLTELDKLKLNSGKKTGTGTITSIPNIYNEETLKDLLNADSVSLSTYISELEKIKKEKYGKFIGKSSKELNAMLLNPDTKDKAKEYLSLLSDINSAKERGKKKSSPSAIESAIESQDLTDKLIKSFNAQVEIDKVSEKLIDKRIKLAEKEKNYSEAIKGTNDKLQIQKKIVDDLNNSNNTIHQQAQSVRKNSKYNTDSWFDVNGEATLAYGSLLQSFKGKTDKSSKVEYENIQKLFNALYALKKAWRENTNEIDTYNAALDETNNKLIQDKITNLSNDAEEVLKPLSAEIERLNNQENLLADNDYVGKQDILNEKLKKQEEITKANENALKDLQNSKLNTSDEKYIEYYDKLTDAITKSKYATEQLKQIQNDYAKSLVQTQLEKEKNLNYDKLETKLAEDKKALESKVYGNQTKAQYEREHQKNIDDYKIQLDDLEKQEQYMSSEEKEYVLQQMKLDLQQNHLTIFDEEIAKLETINELKEKDVERLQKQINLEKQRQLVSNIEKEKDVKIYQNGQWTWQANPQKLADAKNELAEKEIDYAKYKREQALADQEKNIQDQIDAEQKLIDAKAKSYESQEVLYTEAYDKEKTALEQKYKDMDLLTQQEFENLKIMYNNSYDEIIKNVSDKIDELIRQKSRIDGYKITFPNNTSSNRSSSSSSKDYNAIYQDYYKKYSSNGNIIFDDGGEASGIGYLKKDTILPERVLSPEQTSSFNKLVSHLPNLLKSIDITKMMFNNFVPNIPKLAFANGNNSTSNTTQYNFSNVTIQANDLDEFIDSIKIVYPQIKK